MFLISIQEVNKNNLIIFKYLPSTEICRIIHLVEMGHWSIVSEILQGYMAVVKLGYYEHDGGSLNKANPQL